MRKRHIAKAGNHDHRDLAAAHQAIYVRVGSEARMIRMINPRITIQPSTGFIEAFPPLCASPSA